MLNFHKECWNPGKKHSKALVFFAVSKQISILYSADCGRGRNKSFLKQHSKRVFETAAGLILRSCNIWNIFYGHSFPTADSSRAVVSYWWKDEHLVLVNRLGRLPRNSVVRLTDHLDLTIVVDWDIKPQIKQKRIFPISQLLAPFV